MLPDVDALAPFDASSSAIGYAYQLRVALARALELKSTGVDWAVCVEGKDDVELSKPNETVLEQHKQHGINGQLSDKAVDLWKTLRIWSIAVRSGLVDVRNTHFLLVTSLSIKDGTAAALLRKDKRNPKVALSLLETAARTSQNKSLSKAIDDWNKLDLEVKELLLDRVRIIDSSPNIIAVREALEGLAGYAVSEAQKSSFVDYLEGWWFDRCVKSLQSADVLPISGVEFDAAYHRIRERFLADSLPVYDQIKSLSVGEVGQFSSHCFVYQLKFGEVGSKRIIHAVRDYLRAGAQRSSWIREKLLLPQHIDYYEQELIEAWEIIFDRELDSFGSDPTADEKKAAAATVYRWVEDALAPPMRNGIPEPFLIRGSLHILADDGRVGWHPDFRQLITNLVEEATS